MGRFIPDTGVAGIEEDFDQMAAGTTAADAAFGSLKWDVTAIANAGALAAVASPTGIIRHTTAGTAAGDGDAFHSIADGVTFNGKEGGFGFRLSIPDVAGNLVATNDFRIGIEDSVTATDPAVGIFIKSVSGALELQAESTNGDRRVTGLGTLVKGSYHKVDVRWEGENASSGPKRIHVWFDGAYADTLDDVLIGNAETAEYKVVHWNASATTAYDFELDIDYVYFWQAR